jgi:hypothetical protein
VNDDPAGLENRRPFISADGLGNVHVFWHDSRTPGFGSNAALTSIFGTSSLDGGSTWSPNYQVTDELSFFSFNTLAVPNLGDYNQAAATSTGIVHPAWSDQRISTGDVRIPGSNAYSAGRGPETYTTAFALPEITCPANITTQSDPNVCGAVVNYSVFAKGTPAPTVISTPASGSTFPIGTTTVTNSASNGFGVTVTCSFTVTVVDTQKPSISALSVNPASLWPPNHTMRDVAVSYAASDNCPGTTSALSVTSSEPVNGTGDGDSSPDWEIVDATHVRLRAERSGTGPGRVYTVTVTSTDASGNVTVASTSVVVSHNISDPFSGTAVKVGTPVTFGGTFWDIAGRTHSAFWNLDALTAAGVVTEPSGLKSGSVRGSYAFSSAGVYRMKLSIKDDLGGVSSVNTNGDREAMIVVYDPSAGYTVGGGWFASPAGAYPAKPSATGKASFAFTSKYFKNASNPKGEALFQFAAGSLDFSALNYSYLALSGGKATFKGFGKLNDDASYNFMLTAIDGQLMNPIGPDRIHMRIWNKNTGAVVYDNQLNPDPSELTSTPVGDGSNIVITTTSIAGTTGEQPETAEEGGDPAASGSTDDVPKEYGLRQNYPNPFNPATTIGFDLPEDSKVSLVIYNSLGEEIRRLVDGSRSAGRYAPAWDGLNGRGHPVVSGIYFYRLTAVPVSGGEPFVRVMKAIFMK